MRLLIAITGASGSIYAQRLLDNLDPAAHEVHVMLSQYAPQVIAEELPDGLRLREGVASHGVRSMNLPFASGSNPPDAMVVIPCSMGTMGRIAHGLSSDSLLRCADVMLKERRKLLLVPRETPWSLVHVKNVELLLLAGATVLPANPVFYTRPRTIEDLADTVVARVLDHLGVPRVHFVAHSMGGRTAFAVYNREPDRIASFTYSGTNGGAVDDRYRALRTQLEDDGTLAGTLLSRALAPSFIAEQPALHFLYRRIRSLNPPRPPEFLRPGTRLVNFRGTAATRLAQSGRPILWVVGDLDRVVHPDLIAISHDLTPGSRFHVIPGSGHSGYIERPAEWNATVRGFLDEVEDGRFVASPD